MEDEYKMLNDMHKFIQRELCMPAHVCASCTKVNQSKRKGVKKNHKVVTFLFSKKRRFNEKMAQKESVFLALTYRCS